MAGKSNKGRNRRGSQNSTNLSEQSDAPLKDNPSPSESSSADANGNEAATKLACATSEAEEPQNTKLENQPKQGDIHLYPVSVKTQGGEKLELQLSPGDSVMDVRQFLLDAPETCFFTCYDLLLRTKDGSVHHLEDYNEISEVADITTGDCSVEMVAALYDDRSIRAHVQRTRELLSLTSLHSSLSTSLALQHETELTASANSGDPVKVEVPELDSLGFMDDVSGSLTNLLSLPSKEIKCVESVVFSSFNPPPSYRRLSGDLIYLDVVTLEGNKYCITGTTRTFYLNSSTGNILDPKPSKAAAEATTLIGLLQKISSKFKKSFCEILERRATAHPFENVQSLLPLNSWLGLYPVPDHKRDAARAENALTLSFGSELIGMQRDWNEELQSCREFPHTTSQERILRDRALYKVTTDFVDAAISGAIGVISRCIPPINPTDPECFHMYVHNNIFFSFAVDAECEQLSRKQSLDDLKIGKGLLHSSSESSTKSSHEGFANSNGDISNGLNREDLDGVMEVAPDVPAETQLAESEQATYASANNDLKGTKAYQEADVPGLYNLAMAIIDYRGHRVVAQSVLPGILQGDKSDSLLYGSVDNGKKICWNSDFHSKVLEAAKCLHLKEHMVLDGSGNVCKLAAPVECKGIVGSDDRQYLLDLMRITPRDANYTGPGSRFCILRPELVNAFCQTEAAERSKSSCKLEGEAPVATDSPKADIMEEQVTTESSASPATAVTQDTTKEGKKDSIDREICEEIVFNPNVFTEFKLAGSKEASLEIAADEENVRKASLYLRDVVLPKFIQDLCTLEVSPMDGQTLTEALHAQGINVRYIGKDTTKEGKKDSIDREICEEIVFNPNVFTEFKLAGSKEASLEIAADEENVRKASLYLRDVVLPKFIQDLCTLEVSPMDGQTLTEALHAQGINVRYIGKVADGTKHLPHLRDLCSNEIVVRSAKHILKMEHKYFDMPCVGQLLLSVWWNR
ncbi:unnamed protein product [Ilex paraguariensis]|uniref:Clu domain-containing protein n=1 Tax=Ilex paraguariensis TaxID=185542 RepID=A0ABC8SIL1_9AQUA